MRDYTITFTGQVYVPKREKESLGIFSTDEEFINLALIKGFVVNNVRVERLIFSKELDGRLLYKLRFDLRSRDENEPTVTDMDELLALMDCYYKGKIVKYNFK